MNSVSGSLVSRLRRTGRLSLKELREILRDRRTLATLVLMPLLLYPLLSVVLQRYFLSAAAGLIRPALSVAFADEREGRVLVELLLQGGLKLDLGPAAPNSANGPKPPNPSALIADPNAPPTFIARISSGDLDSDIRNRDADIGLRLINRGALPDGPLQFDSSTNVAVDIELLLSNDSANARDAAEFVQAALANVNESFLKRRLEFLGVSQRVEPVSVQVREPAKQLETPPGQSASAAKPGGRPPAVSIQAIIPFILILMTITGAVYPAIDLTAGERERGTMEMLVAAPIPRVSLLVAKYSAVVTVAVMTAAANLIMMTVTLYMSGVGPLLFGGGKFGVGSILAVAGLLLLFAAFFSALLLAITSFARSFKEAQAYLVPLILVSLAPGMVGLTPGLQLSGVLAVTPLANIVLLARDLLSGNASIAATCVVVTSTAAYAAAAITLAARVFGSESVLYNTQGTWADMLRRPTEPTTVATLSSALLCLAIVFPAYFFSMGLIGQLKAAPMTVQFAAAGLATVTVFGGFPVMATYWGRVKFISGLNLNWPPVVAFLWATIMGFTVWTMAHEVVVVQYQWGVVSLGIERIEALKTALEKWRTVPLPVVLLALGVAPAVCEELFFRGYLFAALRPAFKPAARVLISATLFGLFHLVVTDSLHFERFVSSALMGCLLGWVCERTRSIFPGMLLHTLHNSLLLSLAYFEPTLRARGYGIENESHLPTTWLLGGAAAVAFAAFMLFRTTKPTGESS